MLFMQVIRIPQEISRGLCGKAQGTSPGEDAQEPTPASAGPERPPGQGDRCVSRDGNTVSLQRMLKGFHIQTWFDMFLKKY